MKLEVAESAWESLVQLTEYWSDFRSPERIDERVDELWDTVDWLLRHPHAGPKEKYLEDLQLGHRCWRVREVKIVYRVVGNVLRVTQFFDARQDPDKMRVEP
jgi:plasmid stabilization system protein ParE